MPTSTGGFPTRAEFLAAYTSKTGHSTEGIEYYRAFQWWRLAAIVEGVLSRYQKGVMGDPGRCRPPCPARTKSKTESVSFRKGSTEIPYTISSDSARRLDGKVVWYRWIVEYESGGIGRTETDVHRTSIEEAGLPRSATTPGPDGSVALPAVRKRK